MSFNIPVDHRIVRTQATLTRATTGTGTSKIQLYASSRGDTSGGILPLAEILLSNTVGTIGSDGILTLIPANPAGDVISTSGTVVWGRWVSRSGVVLGDGDVTDETGSGFFKLSGISGTAIYAGGLAILSATTLG